MQVKLKVKKDDLVEVMTGREKGKRGKVLRVYPDENRVVVEKINFVKRHLKPGRQTQQGGIIEREGKLHTSNVMVVCHNCDAPVRLGKKALENGKRVRICRKCGEMLE